MILIVEDEPYIAANISHICTELGLTSEFATTTKGAMEALAKTAFRLVVIDLRLPDGSGLDLIKRLRRLPPPFGTVPVLVESGDSPSAINKALSMGADAAIEKPYSLDLLKSRISGLLRDRA